MARKYRQVDPRIWDDEVFDELEAEDALAVMWLITGRAVNRAGVVVCGLGEAADKMRRQGVGQAWDTLSRVCPRLGWPLQKIGRNTVVVILKSWFRYNQPTNMDHLKGMLSDLQDVPRCDVMESQYFSVKTYLDDKWHEAFDTLSKALVTPCPRLDPTPCPHQEQEQEQKQELSMAASRQESESRFRKPTVEDVRAYCQERQNGIDAREFIDHYEAKGWKIGKTRMKSWKHAVHTWENKRNSDPTSHQEANPYA